MSRIFSLLFLILSLSLPPVYAAPSDPFLPSHPYRERLKRALDTYQGMADNGGWTPVPEGRAASKPVQTALAQRLMESGDLDAQSLPTDDGVMAALRHFQQRHGLLGTGELDAPTRSALNMSIETRLRQLQLNLDRWDTLPAVFGPRYLMINIPAYELRVVEDDVTTLRMKVIVGKPVTPTPTLMSGITHIVVNPYWNVPRNITINEIFPQLQQDPTYLERHHMTAVDETGHVAGAINWNALTADTLPYRFRQDPGPHNALGFLKFVFPNPYSVYLHDTNTRSLFDKHKRALSHGCVRLEKPRELATYLLSRATTLAPTDLDALLLKPDTVSIPLAEPVLLFIHYFTAEVDENGTLYFWPDIYRKDKLRP